MLQIKGERKKQCKNIQEWHTECKREEDGYIGRVNEKSTIKLPQREGRIDVQQTGREKE